MCHIFFTSYCSLPCACPVPFPILVFMLTCGIILSAKAVLFLIFFAIVRLKVTVIFLFSSAVQLSTFSQPAQGRYQQTNEIMTLSDRGNRSHLLFQFLVDSVGLVSVSTVKICVVSILRSLYLVVSWGFMGMTIKVSEKPWVRFVPIGNLEIRLTGHVT